MNEQKRRPGYLTKYAQHAGISKPAAAEQLKRVGIDYMQPFDFDDADRRRTAMRHADRAPFAKPIYLDPVVPSAGADDDGSEPVRPSKDPVFAQIQARKEHYRAELARLEFEERIGQLVEKQTVESSAFRLARLVRDAMLNIPARLAGILAAETDQRRVHDLLEQEIRQALEALAVDAAAVPR